MRTQSLLLVVAAALPSLLSCPSPPNTHTDTRSLLTTTTFSRTAAVSSQPETQLLPHIPGLVTGTAVCDCCFKTKTKKFAPELSRNLMTLMPKNRILTTCLLFRCTFRFPSTNIKLVFQSLVEEKSNEKGPDRQQTREAFKSAIAPLKVNIPDSSDFVSPAPSPTGTIR